MNTSLKTVKPDDRVDRILEDPEEYFAKARERASREAVREVERELASLRRRKSGRPVKA